MKNKIKINTQQKLLEAFGTPYYTSAAAVNSDPDDPQVLATKLIDEEIIADLKYFSQSKNKEKTAAYPYPSNNTVTLQQLAGGYNSGNLDMYHNNQFVQNEKLPVVNGKAKIFRSNLIPNALTGELTSNGLKVAAFYPLKESNSRNLNFNIPGRDSISSYVDYSTGEIEIPAELCDSDGEMILVVNYEYVPDHSK